MIEEFKNNIELAVAVAVVLKTSDEKIINDHLDELELLAETAGAKIVERFIQFRNKFDPKTIIGKGKVEEIKEFIKEANINLVIFDDDISPAQLKNLENILQVKVIERTGLILDIFAKNARTNEAKIQVELAQSQYMLTRLTRMWTHLSKQYGGIGTKGPGETQIETDRRILKSKITKLKSKLREIQLQKNEQKKGRQEYPRFALVGYTNAGKSTLLNTITQANVYVEDKLFATLDTTVRTFFFENGQKALLSDTVGFIRKLPPHLVSSFHSTLSEVREADVIVHLVDINSKSLIEHINVVRETLDKLNIDINNELLVFNKIDLIKDKDIFRMVQADFPDSLFISASRGINIYGLLNRMQDKYNEQGSIVEFILPYQSMRRIKDIYNLGDIREKHDKDEGIYFKLRVKKEKKSYFNNLINHKIIIEGHKV